MSEPVGSAPDDAGLGRLIHAVRPLPGVVPVLIGLAVIVAIDALIFFPNGRTWVGVAFGTAGSGVVILAAAGSGLLEQHRVYEHAIVLGLTWPRSSTPYVIPLSTIDPDSVTVHQRANLISRRLGAGGSPTLRMAVYSTRAVSFVGRSWQDAAPAGETKRRLLGLRQAAFGRGPLPSGSTSLWVLGVLHPEPLLDALEQAFAASGRPHPGLAAAALAAPVVEPSGQPRG
jgi:hypothetical protein